MIFFEIKSFSMIQLQLAHFFLIQQHQAVMQRSSNCICPGYLQIAEWLGFPRRSISVETNEASVRVLDRAVVQVQITGLAPKPRPLDCSFLCSKLVWICNLFVTQAASISGSYRKGSDSVLYSLMSMFWCLGLRMTSSSTLDLQHLKCKAYWLLIIRT